MDKLNLPNIDLNIRKHSTNSHESDVFDIIRKKWVTLTPEEYVRQYFIHYMINSLSFPTTHISVEQAFQFENGKTQRADIVAYNSNGKPMMLIECKASSIKITNDIFTQATRYNAVVKAKYIIVTNGLSHYLLSTENFIDYNFEKKIPRYL